MPTAIIGFGCHRKKLWKFFLFCMCIVTNNCVLLCVYLYIYICVKEAANTLMIQDIISAVQLSYFYLWTIFLHYHPQWSYCYDMLANTHYVAFYFLIAYHIHQCPMVNFYGKYTNIFIFTFILSTIVSMSINMENNHGCLLPGFKMK